MELVLLVVNVILTGCLVIILGALFYGLLKLGKSQSNGGADDGNDTNKLSN